LRLSTLIDRALVAFEWRRALRLWRFRSLATGGVIAMCGPIVAAALPHAPLPVFVPGLAVAGLSCPVSRHVRGLAHYAHLLGDRWGFGPVWVRDRARRITGASAGISFP
jgi:hypothetical protein